MATLTLKTLHGKIWDERKRLVSFFIIGLASLLLSLGLYALFSRLLWPNGSHTAEYTVTVVLVTIFNFEANRLFTFGAAQRTLGAVLRFALVALLAAGLNSLLFWIGETVLRLYDFAVIIVVTVIVACFTFTSHRLFTFHHNPWRHMRRLNAKGGHTSPPLQ